MYESPEDLSDLQVMSLQRKRFFGEQSVVDTELAPRVSHNRDQPRQARDGLGSIAVNGTCHV